MENPINRRGFLLRSFHFLLFLFGVQAVNPTEKLPAGEAPRKSSPDSPAKPHSIGSRFARERLRYEITFMMLFNAAHLVIELLPEKKKNRYVAHFRAETKGFVGWITGYRKYHFRTFLEEIEGKGRFLPHRFETVKIIKKKKFQKIYQFDYEKKEVRVQFIQQGLLGKSFSVDFFPDRIFYDILSVFYNFRYGAFGAIAPQRKYQILGLPQDNRNKKENLYMIELFSEKEDSLHRKDFGWDEKGYTARIKIDKELFTTKEGIIWALFDKNMTPLKGILEDAVALGDVEGELDRNS